MARNWTGLEIAAIIDHSLLKAQASRADVLRACAEARKYRFASLCVNPCWVPLCVAELEGSGIPVCTVVGFPLGASTVEAKISEARLAVARGASEIDVVMNIGLAKSGDWKAVAEDLEAVIEAARPALVKAIIETCHLDQGEKVKASGGIRTRAEAIAILDAGASRIGASAGVAIAAESED